MKIFRDYIESCILSLRQEFYHLEKWDLSITDFLNKLTELFDCHTAFGDDISDHDLIMQIFMGLSSEYNPIISAFLARQPLPIFEECRSLLLKKESKIRKQQISSPTSAQAFLAQTSSRRRGCFGSRSGHGNRDGWNGHRNFLVFSAVDFLSFRILYSWYSWPSPYNF